MGKESWRSHYKGGLQVAGPIRRRDLAHVDY